MSPTVSRSSSWIRRFRRRCRPATTADRQSRSTRPPTASAVTPDGVHAFIVDEKITAPHGGVLVVDTTKIAVQEVVVDAEPQNVVIAHNPAAANSTTKAYVSARTTGQNGSVTVFDAD